MGLFRTEDTPDHDDYWRNRHVGRAMEAGRVWQRYEQEARDAEAAARDAADAWYRHHADDAPEEYEERRVWRRASKRLTNCRALTAEAARRARLRADEYAASPAMTEAAATITAWRAELPEWWPSPDDPKEDHD